MKRVFLLLALLALFAGPVLEQPVHAQRAARMCADVALRQEPSTLASASTRPQEGLGGTGNRRITPEEGLGGTGNRIIAPGEGGDGIGGTGILAAAEGPKVGFVNRAVGSLWVVDKLNRASILAAGDAVCEGDTLQTGAKSVIRVTFMDGGELYFPANSSLRIESYKWAEAAPREAQGTLVLLAGGVRSVSGKIAKARPEAYVLQTPDAQVRVMGTDFQVAYREKQDADMQPGTYAAVASGRVSLGNANGTLVLDPGEVGFTNATTPAYRLKNMPTCMLCMR